MTLLEHCVLIIKHNMDTKNAKQISNTNKLFAIKEGNTVYVRRTTLFYSCYAV